MRETFPLGRIAGIHVGANWSVAVILVVIAAGLAQSTLPAADPGRSSMTYWLLAAVISVCFLGSVVAHELAHARVAEHHGIRVERITLWMLGGLSQLSRQPDTADVELRVAIAGPAMSFVIGLVSAVLAVATYSMDSPTLLIFSLGWFAVVNGMLGLFNLLPGTPLDGGRVLTAIIWKQTGNESSARTRAARGGQVLGHVFVALGLLEVFFVDAGGLWLMLLGWFLVVAAREEEAEAILRPELATTLVRDIMSAHPETVPGDLTVDEFVRDHAMRLRHSSYPVVGPDGRVLGLVTLRTIRQLTRDRWPTTRLVDLAEPLAEVGVAAPDEHVGEVLTRLGRRQPRLLVLEGAELVGIVTPSDVTALFQRLELVSRAHGHDHP